MKYTFEILNQWSDGDLEETATEMGVKNASEWKREDLIDFILKNQEER